MRRLEIRPEIGAVTLVKSRLSCSAFSAASACSTAAAAVPSLLQALVDCRGGYGRRVGKSLRPVQLAYRQLQGGLRAIEIGLGAIDRRLVGARIDLEEHVPLLDHRAIHEVDGLKITGDASAHVHRGGRLEASGELVILDKSLLERRRHGHRRRRRGRLLLLAVRPRAGAK